MRDGSDPHHRRNQTQIAPASRQHSRPPHHGREPPALSVADPHLAEAHRPHPQRPARCACPALVMERLKRAASLSWGSSSTASLSFRALSALSEGLFPDDPTPIRRCVRLHRRPPRTPLRRRRPRSGGAHRAGRRCLPSRRIHRSVERKNPPDIVAKTRPNAVVSTARPVTMPSGGAGLTGRGALRSLARALRVSVLNRPEHEMKSPLPPSTQRSSARSISQRKNSPSDSKRGPPKYQPARSCVGIV
jgi:hypothetical protein